MQDFSLNRENPLLLYHQVKDAIKATIMNGKMKPGDRLASEFALMEQYGVSRDTIRDALNILELDGYIERKRGKGTFVKNTESRIPAEESLRRYIAVLIPDVTIYIFAEILKRVEARVRQEGYDLLFYNTYSNVENEQKYIKYLIQKGVSGVIIAPVITSRKVTHYSSLKRHHIPLVFIDSMVPYLQSDYVATENVNGAYKAVDYLLRKGCKTIAHLAGPQIATSGRERFEGYKMAFADNGVPVDMDLVRFTNFTVAGGYKAAKKLLKERRVDAIFGANCWTTVGALNAITEMGLSVSEDIEVGSFDVIEYSFYALQTPSVMVAQPCAEIGETAADILFRRIREKQPGGQFERIMLEPRLVIKGVDTMCSHTLGSCTPVGSGV